MSQLINWIMDAFTCFSFYSCCFLLFLWLVVVNTPDQDDDNKKKNVG